MDKDKSNYPNLYNILDEAQREIDEEREQINIEHERQKQRARIQTAENNLYIDTSNNANNDAIRSREFLPNIQQFVDLLCQKLKVGRSVSRPTSQPVFQPQPESRHVSQQYDLPPMNPEVSVGASASAPPSECDEESDWMGWESGDIREIREDVRENRRLVERTEREIRRLKTGRDRDGVEAGRGGGGAMPVILPFPTGTSSPPIIINNNNNNNNNDNNGGKRCEPERTDEGERSCSRDSPPEKKKREQAEDDSGSSEGLTRLVTGLGALVFGAWGVYQLAKSAGEDVSNEEIDVAANKARNTLRTSSAANSILALSETYQNLDRCLDLWEVYRQRTKAHQSNLNFYGKLVWIPLAGSCATRALLPSIWQGNTGEMLTLGVGLVFAYGALRWLYDSTYYYFANTSKDKWSLSEMRQVLVQV